MKLNHPLNQFSRNIKDFVSNQRGVLLGILALFTIIAVTTIIAAFVAKQFTGGFLIAAFSLVFIAIAFYGVLNLTKRSPDNFDGGPERQASMIIEAFLKSWLKEQMSQKETEDHVSDLKGQLLEPALYILATKDRKSKSNEDDTPISLIIILQCYYLHHNDGDRQTTESRQLRTKDFENLYRKHFKKRTFVNGEKESNLSPQLELLN